MSLRNRFLVYVAVLHAAIAALVVPLVVTNRLWLLAVEVFFVASILLGFRLVRGLFESLDLLAEGARFLDEQEFTTRFKETGRPELDRLVSIYNRLADALRDERTKLREQHHFLSQVLDASPSGVIVLDFDGRIDLVNPAAARSLGLSPEAAPGLALAELSGPLGADLAAAAAGASRVHTTGAGGKIRIVSSRFTDRGHERRFLLLEEMTEEVRAAEKAAYEKLIRMVAHEVGNSVAASSSLLQSSLAYSRHLPVGDRPDFEDAVSVCLARLSTLNGFVRDLAEVVRLPEPRLQPCDLASVLRGASLLLRASAEKAGVEWALEIGDPLPLVSADRAQIEQAFLNIAKNAIEATGAGGRVRVSATPGKDGVDVVVENSSEGIPEDVQARLFTPFFSSKADGRGLGLTLVREILVHHDAPFALVAPAGGPTRFTFSLRKAD
ncbi:MAG: PAS domain-containing protein [Vicinamibacteria bacterium]|nr:PAS domain-containing protein [Vicinamibacteria bacterium]